MDTDIEKKIDLDFVNPMSEKDIYTTKGSGKYNPQMIYYQVYTSIYLIWVVYYTFHYLKILQIKKPS